tara:strand:- start:523 stop:1692 length:1170 start_codon:yes stop_codon:yes gene_type:complete
MSRFDNLKIAFKDKSNKDLKRAYFLFKIINNKTISSILMKLLKVSIVLRLPVKKIVEITIYKHFCGGTSIKTSENVINKLWKSKISTLLDFSAEGKNNDKEMYIVMNETIASIKNAKEDERISFAVFKPSGIANVNLLEKISNNELLTDSELQEKENIEKRFDKICKTAKQCNTPIFIDAEESWIQDAIDDIALKMMEKYNKDKAIVYNTLQMYRIDRINYLNYILSHSKKKKYLIGIKLVRGAYHDKEIQRAIIKNYKCPVHTEKFNTDSDYNKAISICINNINQISLCAGTHNEKSSELLIDLLEKNKISIEDKRVYFSQLLGMSDNISYNAASLGYNVVKYVPYGPVKDVIPYLIRRADENTSIAGQMSRELQYIIQEKNRRKKEN